MKRSWKNFKIDKNKVYMRLGQAVAYTSMWLAGVTFCYWMFLQGMTYQEEKMTKKREKELKKYGISNHEIKEAKEQNKKEKVLLMIAILNWLNAILMLIILLFDF